VLQAPCQHEPVFHPPVAEGAFKLSEDVPDTTAARGRTRCRRADSIAGIYSGLSVRRPTQ
jgi:hypothetical protein